MSHSALSAAVSANRIVLQQGAEIIGALGAERYTTRVPACFNSTVGGHLRHAIEHYQSFFAGQGDGCIDYEKRARDPMIESDPAYARDLLLALAERLDEWLAGVTQDRPMRYAAETSPATEAATSALRELEFLVSHTVHHYALIAIMCRLLGYETPAEFGVAPSTLRYQQAQATCAR